MGNTKKKTRYIPLDILRGLTVILMIFVNSHSEYTPHFLRHAEGNGFLFSDIVFPTFIFCIGLSLFFSLKHTERVDSTFVKKTLIRFAVLGGIGLGVTGLSNFTRYLLKQKPFVTALVDAFKNGRIPGVFFRLAFVSLFAAFIIILAKKNIKIILIVASALLVGYCFLLGFGHGYDFSQQNVLYIVDNAIFTPNHLYHDTVNGVTLSLDPEGLLSTIPCIGQALMAYVVANVYFNYFKQDKYKPLYLGGLGAVLIGLSFLFTINTFIPFNKKVGSFSFVMLTFGIDSILLALFDGMFSFEKTQKLMPVARSFGCNALFIYLVFTLIELLFTRIPVDPQLHHIRHYIEIGFTNMCCGNKTASAVVYALFMVLINIPLPMVLHHKQKYIKL